MSYDALHATPNIAIIRKPDPQHCHHTHTSNSRLKTRCAVCRKVTANGKSQLQILLCPAQPVSHSQGSVGPSNSLPKQHLPSAPSAEAANVAAGVAADAPENTTTSGLDAANVSNTLQAERSAAAGSSAIPNSSNYQATAEVQDTSHDLPSRSSAAAAQECNNAPNQHAPENSLESMADKQHQLAASLAGSALPTAVAALVEEHNLHVHMVQVCPVPG